MPDHAGNCMEFSQVVDSRYRGNGRTWRRRACTKCSRRWTTYEITESEMQRIESLFQFERDVQQVIFDVIELGFLSDLAPGKRAAMPSNGGDSRVFDK